MTRARWLSIACAVAALASSAGAQPHRYLSALEYSVAVPIGDTRSYANGSWTGGVWESRWMDHPHTSIGALVGFNEFYSRGFGTFEFPLGAATGNQYRHLLTVPVLFTAAWYFNENKNDPRWYVGGGGGVQYTEQIFRLGLDDHRRTNWGVALVPEIGLAFSAWYGTGGIVAIRYHLPTESSGFLNLGNRRFQYVSLSMGFGYR